MGRTPAVRHPPRRRMRTQRVRIILGAAPRMPVKMMMRRRMAVRRMATTRRMTKAAMTSAPPSGQVRYTRTQAYTNTLSII